MTDHDELKPMLARFAAQLARSQKPLDPEFDQILRENLWDLYVRSNDDGQAVAKAGK